MTRQRFGPAKEAGIEDSGLRILRQILQGDYANSARLALLEHQMSFHCLAGSKSPLEWPELHSDSRNTQPNSDSNETWRMRATSCLSAHYLRGNGARLVRKERPNGRPFKVRKFIPHDSRPRVGRLNHVQVSTMIRICHLPQR